MLEIMGLSAFVILLCATLVWLISLRLEDVSIVDIFWGAGFAIVSWVSFFWAESGSSSVLVPVLTCLWGLRLTLYLAWRNLGKGEDYRYRTMRARVGPRFRYVSLLTVFGLQGGLIWLVSLPLQASQASSGPGTSWLWTTIGLACFGVGLFFESVGDLQLAAFKSNPANAGAVMDRGLWRYTRHPNYFGDFMVWWGLFLVSVGEGAGLWTVVSPLVMSFLLLQVSGVALLEKTIGARRPGYREYVARTSSFFPRRPK